MKTIYFIVICLVTNLTFAQQINQFDAQGKRHGVWKKNFEKTKVLRYQGEFNHGKEVGVFKFYKSVNNKAVLSATKNFQTDTDLVEVKFYASNKKVISEGNMRGKLHIGKWLYYHNKSNQLMTEEFYNDKGELDGEKKIYYLDGTLAESAWYKSGKVDGESKWYSKTGVLIRFFNYKNGELHGKFQDFDDNGVLAKEGQYQKDRRHGVWKFYKNGKLDKEKDFTRRSKNPYKKK
jgi:antitoxin component YwqK of YwqJK toxin-antitoxin module